MLLVFLRQFNLISLSLSLFGRLRWLCWCAASVSLNETTVLCVALMMSMDSSIVNCKNSCENSCPL